MKKLHIWLAAVLICLSLFSIKSDAQAATAWEKNEKGIYINSAGGAIVRAAKRGIDVSYAQGVIDWEKVKNDDVSFVIIRTGSGANLVENDDSRWEYNVSECERLGIPYGVYHYSRATTDTEAKDEAEHVLRLIQGRSLSYPVYYDLEGTETSAMWAVSNEQHLKNAKVFCETIEAAGYKAGIYANMNWFKNKLTDSWYATQERWIARYNSDYTINWPEMKNFVGMWQCSMTGTVDGINGDVDINFIIDSTPSKVTKFKGTSASYNKYKLTWKAVTGANGYIVQGKKSSASTYKTIKTIKDGATTTYTVGSRTTGTKYDYRIRAYKKLNGKTYYSSYVYIKKAKTSLTKPSITSVKRKNKKVTIKWKKVSGASGYKIYYATKKNGKYKLLKTVSNKKTSYTYKLNKKYYYKIRAYRKVSKKTTVYSSYSSKVKCK